MEARLLVLSVTCSLSCFKQLSSETASKHSLALGSVTAFSDQSVGRTKGPGLKQPDNLENMRGIQLHSSSYLEALFQLGHKPEDRVQPVEC